MRNLYDFEKAQQELDAIRRGVDLTMERATAEVLGLNNPPKPSSLRSFESLKRPEDMTLEEANAEYDRLYEFTCPSTADFQRMSRCSRRINELKQEGE